mmetsp:Transcript_11330/g.16468  ORF Transcript_11330/g.16468 Transcript_11330/m.16468 type:complete len:647 (+) Transcript_11330:120-2060(+)
MLSVERTIIFSVAFMLLWLSLTLINFHLQISKDDLSIPSRTSTLIPSVSKQSKPFHVQNMVEQINLASFKEENAGPKVPFPQSIHNEEWETHLHPAVVMKPNSASEVEKDDAEGSSNSTNSKHMIKMPKFWNPEYFGGDVRKWLGDYGENLISPHQAAAIGSIIPSSTDYDIKVGDAEEVIESNEEGTVVNVLLDKLPPDEVEMLETIYVTIASYRDYRCPHTVEALFEQATHPERVRVGIVDQLDLEEDESCAKPKRSCKKHPDDTLCKFSHQIDVFEMDASLAVGPVFARHIGDRMYRGEYFMMQSDAHMEYVKDWDVEMITQWKLTNNEMAVLSTYVSEVVGHYDYDSGRRSTDTRPIMCATDYDIDYYNSNLAYLMHGQQPEGLAGVKGEPTLHPLWAAGFSFARGHFAVQVPYDQYLPMIFQGEEISIGLRAFTYGYDFYAPEVSMLFHYYSTGPGKKKRKVNKFWEHADSYEGVESESKARLLGILGMLGSEIDDSSTSGERKEVALIVKNKKDSKEEENVEADVDVSEEEEPEAADNKLKGDTETFEDDEEEIMISWNAIDERKYGRGLVRTVQKFLETFGIDEESRKVQENLCDFVGIPMNTIFLKNLRKDAMGIDYSKIEYKFKDPEEYGKTWEKFM